MHRPNASAQEPGIVLVPLKPAAGEVAESFASANPERPSDVLIDAGDRQRRKAFCQTVQFVVAIPVSTQPNTPRSDPDRPRPIFENGVNDIQREAIAFAQACDRCVT